jgi:glycosyltransferase involved in cell wall biosynthesis
VRAEPLISVVVPTRERAGKLRYTLETILAQPGDDFEVVVSDNLSSDATPDVVGSFQDSRLRSLRTDSRLSMCDNWEFAYRNTAGRYVIYIGDDDALAVGAIERARNLISRTPSPVYFWESHIYRWPGNGVPSAFVYRAAPERTRPVSLREMVEFSFRWGGLRYQRLPMLYHSLVDRRILDAIRARTGRLFHSTQPDVFMAFAIPVFCDGALRVGRGLSIYGAAENRDDTRTVGRKDSAFAAKLERFIREYGNYPLHPKLDPAAPFWVNMIPDAMLVAKDLFPEYYGPIPFDFDAMWAFMWRYWRFDTVLGIASHRDRIRAHHPFHVARYLAFVGAHAASDMRIAARRLLRRDRSDSFSGKCPDDIAEFAARLAETAEASEDAT